MFEMNASTPPHALIEDSISSVRLISAIFGWLRMYPWHVICILPTDAGELRCLLLEVVRALILMQCSCRSSCSRKLPVEKSKSEIQYYNKDA